MKNLAYLAMVLLAYSAEAKDLKDIYGEYEGKGGCTAFVGEVQEGQLRVIVAKPGDDNSSRGIANLAISKLKIDEKSVTGSGSSEAATTYIALKLNEKGALTEASVKTNTFLIPSNRTCRDLQKKSSGGASSDNEHTEVNQGSAE